MGLQPAPGRGPVPAIADANAAARLAYYSDGSTAALAPRGWHCASIWGSSGGALLVSPVREDVEAFLHVRRPEPGYGVQLIFSDGGTSGRFPVAAMIARYFPEHIAFARRVAAEEFADALPDGPYPGDLIRRVGTNEIEFVTAGRSGLGTERGILAAAGPPIRGLVILYPEEDMLMMQLSYRLPPADEPAAPSIIDEVRRLRGAARQ